MAYCSIIIILIKLSSHLAFFTGTRSKERPPAEEVTTVIRSLAEVRYKPKTCVEGLTPGALWERFHTGAKCTNKNPTRSQCASLQRGGEPDSFVRKLKKTHPKYA